MKQLFNIKHTNMNKKTCYLVAAMALMLASCSDDKAPTAATDRTPLSISGGVDTRATNAIWHANDAIGLYTFEAGKATIYNQQANLKYFNTAGQGATATFVADGRANTAYLPDDGSAVDVMAYYPYSQLATDNGQLAIDVSNQEDLPAIDLMTSAISPSHTAGNPNVALVFRHRLAKVQIVVRTDETTADIDPATAQITLRGTATKGIYNLLEQKIDTKTDVEDIDVVERTAIVMPTDAGAGVTFGVVAGGKLFNASLPAHIALNAGKVITVIIVLHEDIIGEGTSATISATIADWEDGGEATLQAVHFIFEADPTQPAGTDREVTEFTLYKNRGTAGEVKIDYKLEGDVFIPQNGVPPIYIEDVLPTDRFTAEATLATDNRTGVADIIRTPATAMTNEGIIPLAFAHINAKVTINLINGTYNGDLSTASYTLLGYNLTGVNNTLLLEGTPQTVIPAETILAITAAGEEYKANIASDITLAAGTHTTLTVTMDRTVVDIAAATLNVTLAPWTPGEVGATAVHLFIPNPGEDTSDGALTSFDLWMNADYANRRAMEFDATASRWQITNGKEPFYVENIGASDTFFARFTPTVAEGQTPDILGVQDAGLAANNQLTLDFKHLMSKLTVSIAPGSELTEADVDGAELSIGLKDYVGISVANVVEASAAATTKTLAPGSYVFVPQTLTNVSATVTVGTKNYRGNVTLNLEAGKEATLNITVNPTGITAAVTVTDWEAGDIFNGDFELE